MELQHDAERDVLRFASATVFVSGLPWFVEPTSAGRKSRLEVTKRRPAGVRRLLVEMVGTSSCEPHTALLTQPWALAMAENRAGKVEHNRVA